MLMISGTQHWADDRSRRSLFVKVGLLLFSSGLAITLLSEDNMKSSVRMMRLESRQDEMNYHSSSIAISSSNDEVQQMGIISDENSVGKSDLQLSPGTAIALSMKTATDIHAVTTLSTMSSALGSFDSTTPSEKKTDAHSGVTPTLDSSSVNSLSVVDPSLKLTTDTISKGAHYLDAPPISLRTDISAESFLFELKNSYTASMPLYDGYPWKFIVEPHKLTTLSVAEGITTPEGYTYHWKIDAQAIGEGTSITHTFTTRWYARSYVVTLTETTHQGTLSRVFESNVMCKYVRREIRSLTHEDRETYFSTHLILQELSEDDGRALYGPKYHNKDYFNRKHAGLPGCSAYHKGAQFIGTHMALTLEFEQVLQAIDASVSVPYWDWTIDDASLGQDWRTSIVFDRDWFGSAAPDDADNIVTEGRWAYTPILTQAWNYSLKTNPYGYLTDAWNMIKKPYMSRSPKIFGVTNTQPLPTCGDHYMCLTIDNWMDFTDCIENYAHENVHQLLGGVWHSEHTLERLLGKHPEYRKLLLWLASRADRVIMSLHTKQVMQCPDVCSIDTPFESCRCSCPSLEGSINKDSLSYLENLGVFTYLSYRQSIEPLREAILYNSSEEPSSSAFLSESQDEIADIDSIHEMMQLYCNPGMIGDQYTSFATNDPVFWPIHPTLERLWQFKRLAANEGFDETWEDVDGCPGHNLHDIHPFKNLVGETSRHHYSNKDLYDMLDPRNPDLPYLYDNFQWDHCSETGIDLKSAPLTLGNAGMYQSFTTYSVRETTLENPDYVPKQDQKNSASQVRITTR